MRKLLSTIYLLVTSALVLSMSGCGGSSVSNNDVPSVTEVAVIQSPAFEVGSEYKIIKGATLGSTMSGARYFVKDMAGSNSNMAALNLGFSERINETLVFVKMNGDKEGPVVFAYDPSGKEGNNKVAGSVTYSGGTELQYRSLTLPSGLYSSMNVDTSSAKVIVLSGDTATIDGASVNVYDYVWHADPDHADEYYTLGLDGTDVLSEDYVLDAIGSQTVYIAHDVRYMTNSLDFTATVKNDDETEYAAYYSATVSAEVAATLSPDYGGPYIFTTLPMSGGMGGNPGGEPGGNPPNAPSGDMTPPSGDSGGMTPPNAPFTASVAHNRASYNTQIASTMALMTHSASEAYSNPVLHITEPGVYELQGTWNGQIWIEVGKTSEDKAAIILNDVDVTCTVAPALVFKKVWECGPDDEDEVYSRMAADSSDIGNYVLENAGAIVLINDDTVNNFTGSNVYRMLKPLNKKDSTEKIDGTDVSQQKKLYKMDGAFYSFMSMAIGAAGSKGNGVLNVYSTSYEGLDTEMHAVIDDGIINVVASDDGMNFNEDDVSVFTLVSGELTVITSGGDGIDSNGYIVLLGGSLDITAAQDSDSLNAQAEGPLDADCGVYMADGVHYTHRAYSSTGGGGQPNIPPTSGDVNPPESGDINIPPASGDVTPPSSGDVTPPESGDVTPPASGDNTPSTDPSTEDPDDSGSDTPSTEPSTNTDEPDIVTPPSGNDSGSGNDTPSTPSTPSTDDPDVKPNDPDVNPNAPDNNTPSDDSGSETPSEPTTPTIPDNTPVYTPDVPAGWDTDTVTIESTAGTTLINLNSSRTLTDTQASEPRNIPLQSKTFKLTRQVNTFSGITTGN